MRDPRIGGRSVSRETYEKLKAFEELVRTWSQRINLVSISDQSILWERHLVDSAQLIDLTDLTDRWLDLGSGGGFPGVVIAILLEESRQGHVTLVESDNRKCAFLKTAARTLSLDVDIRSQRIEQIELEAATTLSARALAPLETLVAYGFQFLAPDGIALFPKGRNWKNELEAAKVKWSFDCDVIQSITEADAAILKLRNIERI